MKTLLVQSKLYAQTVLSLIIILFFILSHLPPSQGGKYAGFGYSRDPPPKTQSQEIVDSTLSSLASGWSLFSTGASKIAVAAKEKAVTTVSLASSKVS